jgi:signal transduction histidine kinase
VRKVTTEIKDEKPEKDEIAHIRALSHDLSNSLEAILQAAYLLGQSRVDDEVKRWVQVIDSSSQEAASLNREIRKLLRSLSR